MTPNSSQPDFTLPSIATLSRHYIDVNLTPAGSHTVNAGTVDGGEITLSASGVTVLTTSDAKPTNIKGTIYRYYLSGNFTALGPVTVTFGAGAWQDSAGASNVASSGSFTIVVPSASVSGPFTGDNIESSSRTVRVTAPR